MIHSLATTIVSLLTYSSFSRCYASSETYNSTVVQRSSRLQFVVPDTDPVALRIDTGVRYGLDQDGTDEWEHIIPHGGHLVYIDDDMEPGALPPKPYTVTLLHQLKCLQTIRLQYLSPAAEPISAGTQHCMNYLRQTLLCRMNMGIESVVDAWGRAERGYDAVCKDWTALFDEVDRNQRTDRERNGL